MSTRILVGTLGFLTACSSGGEETTGGHETGDRTYVVPFTPYWDTSEVKCGPTYEGAGVSAASFELKDFLMFVYDVQLVREGGNMCHSGFRISLTAPAEDDEGHGGGH